MNAIRLRCQALELHAAVLAGAGIAASPVLAWGQDARERVLEHDPEIVVTAQYRPQEPIDVPVTLSVVTGDMLDRIGAEDFEELSRFVPGFAVQKQSLTNPGFVMRGISSDSGTAFSEPRVSVFQDGVSISKSRGSFIEIFDVERVEVAKGPQTTLYGRSALIGAVNVIQNKADPARRSAYWRAEHGTFDYVLSEAAINLPFGEGAAARIAGRYRKRDGTIENLHGGEDYGSISTGAVRGALHLEPAPRLTIDLIGNYQHDDPTATGFVSLTKRQTDPVTGSVLAPLSPFSAVALTPGANLDGGRRLGFDREVYGVTGLAGYELNDALRLDLVSGWRRFQSLEWLDPDGLALPILFAGEDARHRQFNQDVRLVWDSDGALSGLIGASYYQESGSQRVPVSFDERLLLAQLTGSLNGRIPGRPTSDPAPLVRLRQPSFSGALLRGFAASRGVALSAPLANAIAANLKTDHQETTHNFASTRALDVFADATVRPVDSLELNAGIRYSSDRKRTGFASSVANGRSILGGFVAALSLPPAARSQLLAALARPGAANTPPSTAFPVPLFGLAGQPTTGNGKRIDRELEDEGLTFRATARYIPNPDVSLYAGFARGRRPEVLSARTPTTPGGEPRFENVPAEVVDSFEAGAKTALLDGRLLVDGALYHYRYRNFQTVAFADLLLVTINAGRARSTGFEGQFRLAATESIDLFGSYAYNRSRFRSGALRGNRFSLSPDHTFSLGALASLPLTRGALTFTPTVTYQSKTFFSTDNDRPELQQPPNALIADNVQDEFQKGYAFVNARVGYGAPDLRWRIEGFVENLFDKRYVKDAGNLGDALGLPTAIAGTPRTAGAALHIAFGP